MVQTILPLKLIEFVKAVLEQKEYIAMVFRLILTLVLVSTVAGCMPEKTQGVNREEAKSGQTPTHQASQDEITEELYLPGQN